MTTKSEWQKVNRELLAEARAKLGEPPTAEEMFRYRRGELSEAEAERIREFLVAYPELARAFAEPAPEEPRPGDADYVTDEEVQASWEALQRKRTEKGKVVSFRYVPTWIAATLAIILGGLFAHAEVRARRFEAELLAPISISEPIELQADAESTPRSEQPPPKTITTRLDAYRFMPALSGTQRLHYPHYRIEIVRESETKAVWSTTNVERHADNSFDFAVRRNLLAPGVYQMRILGLDGQKPTELDTYRFRIE